MTCASHLPSAFSNVPTSGFAKCTYFWFCKMYILLVLQIVHTSGFVKCTYFWISNMYILLLYLILVLQNVPTSDVHNSVLSKCTYFWIVVLSFMMYILLVLQNVPTSGSSNCIYFWFCKMYLLLLYTILDCNMYLLLMYTILVFQNVHTSDVHNYVSPLRYMRISMLGCSA